MDDVAGQQSMACRDPRLAGWAAVQLPALLEETWSGSSVNRAVNPTTAEQRLISSVHNRIRVELRDVTFDYPDSVENVA